MIWPFGSLISLLIRSPISKAPRTTPAGLRVLCLASCFNCSRFSLLAARINAVPGNMAEAAGLSLSVVSVATLFSAFFDTVQRIRQLRGSGGDVKEAIEALDVEQKRLLWIRDKYKTDQLEEAEPMLAVMLNLIVKELNTITAVIDKYESRTSSGEWTKSKVIRPIAWITKDKTEVAGRLSKLHSWVDSLCSLAASESERLARDYLVRAEAVSTCDDENLERLESLNTDLYADISKAARVKRFLLRSRENSTIKVRAILPSQSFSLAPANVPYNWLRREQQNQRTLCRSSLYNSCKLTVRTATWRAYGLWESVG